MPEVMTVVASGFFLPEIKIFEFRKSRRFFTYLCRKEGKAMLCKYYLQLGTSTIDTSSGDCMDVSRMIKNLDSIKVTYARVDLGGVVRKCGSTLEFTGRAYDAIVGHYSENYLQSSGVFAVYMADNNWNYDKAWECPLDFATLQYDANVCKIGCIDNSAAAIIKSNKKSKYEFDVASLKDSSNLLYNGVVTKRTFKFSLVGKTPTGETTADQVPSILLPLQAEGWYTLYVFGIGVNREDYGSEKIEVFDQTEGYYWHGTDYFGRDIGKLAGLAMADGKAGFIKCLKACSVHVNMNVPINVNYNPLHLNNCSYEFVLVAGDKVMWSKQMVNGINTLDINVECPLEPGWKIALFLAAKCTNPHYIWDTGESTAAFTMGLRWGSNTSTFDINESHYIDAPVDINVIKPITLLNSITKKMFESHDLYADCSIIGNDTVLPRTMLIAAESVRRISSNKIYTSFADFCTFMETVFGYVYSLKDVGYLMDEELRQLDNGERDTISHIKASYLTNIPIVNLSGTWYKVLIIQEVISEDVSIDYETEHVVYNDPFDGDAVVYCEKANVFACLDRINGVYYANFGGNVNNMRSYLFNDGNHAKEMLCVRIGYDSTNGYLYGIIRNGKLVQCDARHGSGWLDSDENNKYNVKLIFKHRDSIFVQDTIKRLENTNNLSYELDDSKVYSDVEVGYPKQDYDNYNSAKAEYNFTNYYKTDSHITDDTLSLICPYRADCYGIEELLVKSDSEESTDSDNDVFIVVTSEYMDQGRWQIDRSVAVLNGSSNDNTVFNAAIAPNKIVLNNEGLIGSSVKQLKFTSSDGNSGAVIGGSPMSDNITITKQLFKAGKISIDTDDHYFPETWDGLIEFEYADKTYRGYLDSIDIDFANLGTITYNLIEQCIE
jgi:hypothetical protein